VKDILKYGSWVVIAIVALVLGLILGPRVLSYFEGYLGGDHAVFTPADSTFVPVVKREYKPRSTPFERPSKPPVRLPKGVKESDVKRVIVVTEHIKTDSSRIFFDSTTVIELKSGAIYVPKEHGKELTVEEFNYVPPVLDFGLFCSVGASVGRYNDKFTISPLMAASLLQICGVVQFPLVMADLQGVGAGFGIRQGDFMIGAFSHWRFEDMQRQIKLSIQYSIN